MKKFRYRNNSHVTVSYPCGVDGDGTPQTACAIPGETFVSTIRYNDPDMYLMQVIEENDLCDTSHPAVVEDKPKRRRSSSKKEEELAGEKTSSQEEPAGEKTSSQETNAAQEEQTEETVTDGESENNKDKE